VICNQLQSTHVLPQWRPVPLLVDIAVLAQTIASRQATMETVDQKDRNEQRQCNNAYATCGGGAAQTISSLSVLFESAETSKDASTRFLSVPISYSMLLQVAIVIGH
jgi:hypothetical protein